MYQRSHVPIQFNYNAATELLYRRRCIWWVRRTRRDFPGGPVVKIRAPNTAGPGSILDGELLRSSIPHAAQCSQKAKMKKVPGSPGAQGRVEMCQDQYPVGKTQETVGQTAQSFNR